MKNPHRVNCRELRGSTTTAGSPEATVQRTMGATFPCVITMCDFSGFEVTHSEHTEKGGSPWAATSELQLLLLCHCQAKCMRLKGVFAPLI